MNQSLQFDRSCSVSPIPVGNQKMHFQNNSLILGKEMSIIDQESISVLGGGHVLQELPLLSPDSFFMKNHNQSHKFSTLLSNNQNNTSKHWGLNLNINEGLGERLKVLKQMVHRMQQFIKLAIEKLITLSVSKH